MIKPKGFKILTGILAFLVIITVIFTIKDKKKDPGNFKSTVVDVKAADINKIEFIPAQGEGSYKLIKGSKDEWEVITESDKFAAQTGLVNDFLYQITKLKAKQVVARSSQKWDDYHVTDSLGSEVILYKDNDILADIVIGRMTFTQSKNPYQQYPDALSYIRVGDDEAVYAVEGMLKMMVSQKPDDFRDGHIVRCETQDLKNIRFIYPSDSSLILSKADTIWKIGDQKADSLNTQNYLNSIRRFVNRDFAPSNIIEGKVPLYELVIEGNNMDAIKIQAFQGEDNNHYITSTINSKTVFNLDKTEFERLFKGRKYFIP